MIEEKEKRKNTEAQRFNWRFWLMIGLAIAYGIVARIAFKSPLANDFDWDVVSIAFILGVPAGIGAITAFFTPASENSLIKGIALSTGLIVAFIAITVFAALEIWICVLMAAVPMIIIGALIYVFIWIVRKLYETFFSSHEKPKRFGILLYGILFLLPYWLAPIEAQIDTPTIYREIEDSIIINSDAQTVWENIIRMETINPEEQFPTLFQSIGIPRPIRATLSEEGLGGLRRGEFEYGLLFYEVITVWQPYEEVRFTVKVNHNNLESPALAQIGGEYLDIVEAGYRIESLETGEIQLHLSSRYRLTTNFNDYAALWADWIMHDFQNYVLQTVKERVES